MEHNINAQDIKLLEKIGSGRYSDLYTAKWNNKLIAAKKYSKAEYAACKKYLCIDNEFILQFYGSSESSGIIKSFTLVLMEYADCGSLHQQIHDTNIARYQTDVALNWMHQCAQGIAFLHSITPTPIMLYNLRPSNLFLCDNYKLLKIGNWILVPKQKTEYECRPYEAPEGKDSEHHNEKYDVFTFGMLLWEVLSQPAPDSLNDWNLPLTLSSDSMRSLIKSCLDRDPAKRPNMESVATSISSYMGSFRNIIFENKDMELGENIGSGAFGTVYKAQLRNVQYAVKKCFVDDIDAKQAIVKEVKYLSEANHKNIIKLFGIMLSKDAKTTIVMEFADCGALYNYLHQKGEKKRSYTFLAALNWMNQLALGLEYLHAMKPRPVIHRDIKTKNLLLANRYKTLKIGDFGSVTEQATVMTQNVGTAQYMAPEVAEGRRYTEKSDVYSFGIVLWEVMSQKIPFSHLENSELLTIIFAVSKGQRPSIHDIKNFPNREHIQTIIQNCWHVEPEKRSSMTDLALMLSIDYNSSDFNSFKIKRLPETTDVDYPLLM